jgi:chemotaxis response regulator CheB
MMAARVLIVDDDQQTRALASVLERGGYEVAVASDAQGAIAVLREGAVDAVLCAWMLANAEGVDLIRRIRARVRPCPPILMRGAIEGQEMLEEAFRAGADDYLVQPLEAADLLARVERCIGRYRRAHGLQSGLGRGEKDDDGPTQRRRAVSRQTVRLGSQLHIPGNTLPPVVAVALCVGAGGGSSLEQLLAQLASPAVRHASFFAVVHDTAWHDSDPCGRLSRQLNMNVSLASAGAPLAAGCLQIAAPGAGHVVATDSPPGLRLVPPPPRGGVCPSADWLFRSLSEVFGRFVISVVLAGEGKDAAIGSELIVRGGGVCLIQDPEGGQPSEMVLGVEQRVPVARRIALSGLGETVSRYVGELSRQLLQARGEASS